LEVHPEVGSRSLLGVFVVLSLPPFGTRRSPSLLARCRGVGLVPIHPDIFLWVVWYEAPSGVWEDRDVVMVVVIRFP